MKKDEITMNSTATTQASDERHSSISGMEDEVIQPTAEQMQALTEAGLTPEQIAAFPSVRGLTDEQILLALNIGALPEGRELTLEEIAALSDDDIDFSDIPKPDDEYWAHAVVIHPKPTKELVSIRLDVDVLEYFKRPGAGYQTRINAVLRLWIKAQTAAEAQKASRH
jgi:uncharacterized protein (DUF4415 family)